MPDICLREEAYTLKTCIWFWVVTIASINFVSHTSILFVLLLILLSLATFLAIQKYSLPRGDEMLIKEIFGTDLNEYKPKSVSDNTEQTESGNDFVLKSVAHRFAGLDAPENTLEALNACHKAGCVAVEFDISMTSDKVLIVFHDDTVDRMTSDTGEISSKSWSTVSEYNTSVNHPFRDRYPSSKVPEFESVIQKCLEYDMRIFIDIKDSNQEVVNGVCSMFEKYPMLYRRAVVSSFNPLIVYQIRQRKPAIAGCMAWRPYYFSYGSYTPDTDQMVARTRNIIQHLCYRLMDIITTWLFFRVTYRVVGLSAVLIHKDTITRESIKWWRNREIRCLAWTINLPSEKVHFTKNFKLTYLTDTMHAT